MTYFKTSKSAYFMVSNSRTSPSQHAGFCLGNGGESARYNLCVTVGHGLCIQVPCARPPPGNKHADKAGHTRPLRKKNLRDLQGNAS